MYKDVTVIAFNSNRVCTRFYLINLPESIDSLNY
jgi:hypothetical protein